MVRFFTLANSNFSLANNNTLVIPCSLWTEDEVIFHCLSLPLFDLNQELAGGYGIAGGIAATSSGMWRKQSC